MDIKDLLVEDKRLEERITTAVTAETYQALEGLSKSKGIGKGKIVRAVLEEFLISNGLISKEKESA